MGKASYQKEDGPNTDSIGHHTDRPPHQKEDGPNTDCTWVLVHGSCCLIKRVRRHIRWAIIISQKSQCNTAEALLALHMQCSLRRKCHYAFGFGAQWMVPHSKIMILSPRIPQQTIGFRNIFWSKE